MRSPALLLAALLLATGAGSQSPESVLYQFHPYYDGIGPRAGVIVDNAGDLFGTTFNGGHGKVSEGSVYELLAPAMKGGAWSERILHSFPNYFTGQYPWTGLVGDVYGNIYGTTWLGGNGACQVETCGVVFQLSPQSGGGWSYHTLHNFSGPDGAAAQNGNMAIDAEGNLYGTTVLGGTGHCSMGGGCGVIFEVGKHGGAWFEDVLYDFPATGSGAGGSGGDVVLDAHGNLYGTTTQDNGVGTVFELAHPTHGGDWTYRDIHFFGKQTDGINPLSGLTFGPDGALYGSTQQGGRGNCYGLGCGVVYRLQREPDGKWAYSVVYRFDGTGDGSLPQYDLTVTSSDVIYGIGTEGGTGNGCVNAGCGVVFRLTPDRNGGWAERVLHTFRNGGDGYVPVGRLVFGKGGKLYGATSGGGDPTCSNGFGCGTVFSIGP